LAIRPLKKTIDAPIRLVLSWRHGVLAAMTCVAVGAACAPRPPVLAPLPVAPTQGPRDVVVQVRPIDTRLGSEDRRHYGVDMGAYFAAFLVHVENRTPHDLAVDLHPSTLGEPSSPGSPVLSDDEMVRTYRRAGLDESAVELIAKAPAVVKRELEQIRASRIPATQLGPAGRVEGVLLFRPPNTDGCAPSVLTIRGIEILDEPQLLEFEFPLDPCGTGTQGGAR
jgi:hypothetical protein